MLYVVDAYHCKNTSNIGDRSASPALYPYFGITSAMFEVDTMKQEVHSGIAVIGGGGLIQHYLTKGVRLAMSRHSVNILWGIGLNGEDVRGDSYRDKTWLLDADLVGVRDWGPDVRYRWVPCPSCMHPIFDTAGAIAPQHNYVLYEHHHHPLNAFPEAQKISDYIGYSADLPHMTNAGARAIEDVVRFLASGRCVLTSSYHGAYWATLLGRKVAIVKPWSSKFMRMRFPPVIFGETMGEGREYPEALQECRQTNLAFADDVRILLRSIS